MQFTKQIGTSTNIADTANAEQSQAGSTAWVWVLQGVLAAVFLFAGVSKLVISSDTLADSSDLPVLFLRFVGICETLGALGLLLPGLLNVRRELTPLAACGLVGIMVGATVVTVAGGEIAAAGLPVVVGVIAAFVAYRRRHEGAFAA